MTPLETITLKLEQYSANSVRIRNTPYTPYKAFTRFVTNFVADL